MKQKTLDLGFSYFRKGVSFLTTDSTNNRLALEVEKGNDVQMVTSAIQTKGRGRRDKVWHSERGGLWVSFLLPNIIPEEEMTMLNISCGLACARACERLLKHMEYAEFHTFIRWPNDIMIKDRKLGGMLIEVKSEGKKDKEFILGIGINANQKEFQADIKGTAISLFQVLDRRVSRVRLLFLLLKELEAMIDYIDRKGTDGLLFDWQQHSYELGRHIEISTGKEGRRQGKVIGLGKRGELTIIDTNDDISSIHHGYNLKILDK